MKNPCSNCIIKMCCTKLCKAKENYTEVVLMKLSLFCKENVYDEKGYPSTNSKDKSIKKQLNEYKRVCEKNNKEISKIILRGPMREIGLNLFLI